MRRSVEERVEERCRSGFKTSVIHALHISPNSCDKINILARSLRFWLMSAGLFIDFRVHLPDKSEIDQSNIAIIRSQLPPFSTNRPPLRCKKDASQRACRGIGPFGRLLSGLCGKLTAALLLTQTGGDFLDLTTSLRRSERPQ